MSIHYGIIIRADLDNAVDDASLTNDSISMVILAFSGLRIHVARIQFAYLFPASEMRTLN